MDKQRTRDWLGDMIEGAGGEDHSSGPVEQRDAPVTIHATTPWGEKITLQAFEG